MENHGKLSYNRFGKNEGGSMVVKSAIKNIQSVINHINVLIDQKAYQEMTSDICQLFLYAKQSHDPEALTAAHFYLGYQEYELNHYESSIHALQIAIEVSETHQLEDYIIRSHNMMGALYAKQSDYYSSLEHYLRVFYICKDHPKSKYKASIFNNLGSLFYELQDYEFALDYYEQAYTVCMNDPNQAENSKPIILLNIIETLTCMEKYDEVMRRYQEDEAMLLEYDLSLTKCMILLTQALKFHSQKADELALQRMEIFLKLSEDSDDYDYLFKGYVRAANLLIDMHQEALAVQTVDRLNKIQKFTRVKLQELLLKRMLIRFYEEFDKTEQYQQSLVELYRLLEEIDQSAKLVYHKCMRLKINLERLTFEQRQIMKQNEELQRSVNLDPFTEIYNKVYVEQLIEQHLRQAQHTRTAMLLIDIDMFKCINDTYGHTIGDYVIKESVRVLRNALRADDIVGRVGGDEFVVFFNTVYSEELVYEKAALILKQISNVYIKARNDAVTVSIGVCICDHAASYQQLFARADEALYRAKANGRNQYAVWKGECA